jgi:ABC-type multidrug transport system ATPase subunit
MVKQTLKSVNLTQAGDRKADGYSGGMKRRLSVANALAGNPDIVYME